MYVVEVGQVPAHTEPISTVALRGLGIASAYILVFLKPMLQRENVAGGRKSPGRPRPYISSRCVNAISELLEYNIEVKERDHTVDGIRYGIPLKSTAPLNAFRLG